MADGGTAFWNTFRVGQEAREWWDDRGNRREAREARMDQRRALRDQYGARGGGNVDDTLAFTQEDRSQQEFDAENQRRAALSALTAYRGMVSRAEGDGLRVDPEQQRSLRGAAFDRIASVLPALGVENEQIPVLREMLIDDPARADQLIRAIQAGDGESASYAPRAVIDPNTGRPIFVRPGDEVGMESADEAAALLRIAQGDQRLSLGRDQLEHRQYVDDPAYQEERAFAGAGGRERGEMAAALARLDEITDTAIGRIDALVSNEALDSVFGLPNLARLEDGGFGAAGVVPGTPAADALALLNQTMGDVQTAAYESLRGGGQITEAEREAIARGLANLDRAQSPAAAVRALQQLAGVLDRRRNAQHRAAASPVTGRRPAVRDRDSAPAAPAPAPAPAGGIREEGEDTDALLDRLGL